MNKNLKKLLDAQKNEITEYHIYKSLAEKTKNPENKKILIKLSNEELKHYNIFKKYTKKELKPNKLKILKYKLLAKTLGLSFALRLLEGGEKQAQNFYKAIENIDEIDKIIKDEENHEKELISLISEEHLDYASSIVLGLNDALVELTGVLAGLSFALNNTHLIGIAGLITGVSASLSMAASEYLSSEEEDHKNPLKSSTYTGIAYITTVLILITPYFVISKTLTAMFTMLSLSILLIFLYTYYITTAKDQKLWPKFSKMASISLSVALISYIFGYIVNKYIGI